MPHELYDILYAVSFLHVTLLKYSVIKFVNFKINTIEHNNKITIMKNNYNNLQI